MRPGLARLVVLSCLGAIVCVASERAAATPSGMTASPRLAPAGAAVTIAGSGCSTPVHVVVQTHQPFQPPTLPLDTSVAPDGGGAWSLVFPMPSLPAYVTATCDSASAVPIVIAPSDGPFDSMTYSSLTPEHVVVSTSPLVDGSTFTIFDATGGVLASSIVSGGAASVSLPRSLGPAVVTALSLRQPDPGSPLNFPKASRIQLPAPSDPTIVVAPRVSGAGDGVVASGSCSGTTRVLVTGQPAGWYDVPPQFVDALAPTDPNGRWTLPFAMPPSPSTAQVVCTDAGVTAFATTLISPSSGALPASHVPDGDGVIVSLPDLMTAPSPEAFTSTGAPVPLTLLTADTVRITPPPGMNRIVVVGIESLGENAQARQNSRVQAWYVDVEGEAVPSRTINGAAPASGLAVARRLAPP